MAEKHVWVTNTINGLAALVPERYLIHPVLGATLKASRSGKPVVRLVEPAVSDAEIANLEAAEATDKKKKED